MKVSAHHIALCSAVVFASTVCSWAYSGPAAAEGKTPESKAPESKAPDSKAPDSKAPSKRPSPRDPWAGVKLIQPPQPTPPGALTLPKLRRFVLPNGLHVLVLRDTQLPLIDVKLTLLVGSVDDPADRVGLADYTTMMLRQGVRGMSAEKTSSLVDSAGAYLRASPGYEISSIVCGGRQKTLSLCLRMVSAMVKQPTFPESEMPQVSRQLVGEVRQARDDPNQLTALHFYNQMYGDDHPGGRPLTLGSIGAIKRADLLRFFERHFVPSAAILSISGDVDPAALKAAIEQAFGGWKASPRLKGGKRPARKLAKMPEPSKGLRVLLVDKPDLTQSFFAIGHPGVSFRHPDRDALRVANYVLGGGGFSSRLMKVVRSKGGKTYGINSGFFAHEADGVFRVRSSTRNAEIVHTLALVRRELAAIRSRPPTAREIAGAKGKIAGGYAIRFKTAGRLAAALALAELRQQGDAYVSELPLRVQRLDAATIARAARAHIHPNRLVATIVGKGDVVAPLLKAANIPFERISYLAPISAGARAKLAQSKAVTPAQQKAGLALLAKATKAIGGAKALAQVKRLRLTGKMIRSTSRGRMTSRYAALMIPPDHLRLIFVLTGAAARGKPLLKMEQVLAGKRGFLVSLGKKRALPARQIAALRAALWRQPALVLRNAAAKGVKLRPLAPKSGAQRVGLEVFPPGGIGALTLIFNKRFRLVRIERLSRGRKRASDLSLFKKVKGLWLPHVQSVAGGKVLLELDSIEINPRITIEQLER